MYTKLNKTKQFASEMNTKKVLWDFRKGKYIVISAYPGKGLVPRLHMDTNPLMLKPSLYNDVILVYNLYIVSIDFISILLTILIIPGTNAM